MGFPAWAGRVDETRRALSKLLAWNAPMKASAVRVAAGLALVAVCTPFPASSQYFPPVLIIVPPPAQDYGAPKPAPNPPPDKPKSTDASRRGGRRGIIRAGHSFQISRREASPIRPRSSGATGSAGRIESRRCSTIHSSPAECRALSAPRHCGRTLRRNCRPRGRRAPPSRR